MFNALYTLIIYPIELFLEVVFSVIYDLHPSACLAIIGVSLVVNILLLPLYDRADRISREERNRQEAMSQWIGHIKTVFRGDERFMMLQAYYRKQGYRPIYALRSSISLILQVPFFIAAYHFLSNLELLNGYAFHFIRDLGRPDGLLSAGSITVNILPIIMTVINLMSIAVYTRKSPLKEKLQLTAMAVVFLIILYDSPSGLVIYWTMNNVFSLVKSVFYSIREGDGSDRPESAKESPGEEKLYLWGVLILTVLTGLVIPMSLIVSSPEEFVTLTVYKDPVRYALNSLLMAAGTFLIWFSVFYYLLDTTGRRLFRLFLWLGCGAALADFLLFGKIPLTISSELVFRGELVYEPLRVIANAVSLAVLLVILYLIWRCRHGWVKSIYQAVFFGLVIMSVLNIAGTEKQLSKMSYLKQNSAYEGFTLSKKGRNVVVIMLDGAIGPYIPFIMAEKPELMEKYSGFVYYSNTLSHGEHTIMGAPGLYGGYEYTPEGMDGRPDEKLVDKHDEALSVLPVLFSENGYKTTVYDPPLAGYNDVSDLSIYDPYPEVHAYSLKNRFISEESVSYTESYRKRQFFMYSIFKTVPLFMQSFIYRGGTYHYPGTFSVAALKEANSEFADSYAILDNLPGLTGISESEENTFMIMDNDTTHDPSMLQLPDYIWSDHTDNTGLETGYRTDGDGNTIHLNLPQYYHINMGALMKLGEWLDHLKEEGVYDNTRIIIVSDHGSGQKNFEDLILEDGTDIEGFSPLLLFKDFGKKGFNTEQKFMTNADTPVLAVEGLITDPVNPFTGVRIDDSEKQNHAQLVLASNITDTSANVFVESDQVWYRVRDDIRDSNNWQRIDED